MRTHHNWFGEGWKGHDESPNGHCFNQDKVIHLVEDDDTSKPMAQPQGLTYQLKPPLIAQEIRTEATHCSGYNRFLPDILRELDNYQIRVP